MSVYVLPKARTTYNYRYFLPYAPEWGPAELCEQRLHELLEFCGEARIDAVQLFVNILPGTYYMPAHDAAEQAHYAAWIRELVVPALRRIGVSYQLNFQMLLGGHSHGLDMREDYDWEFLVDQHGAEAPGCACPLGERFREKMGGMLRLWAATGPDILWIDDDFRMHNHGTPARGECDFYCFCEVHLTAFARQVGRRYSREEIVAGLLKPGPPDPLRLAWLDFLGGTMTGTAAWINHCVQGTSPRTRLALMTSLPDVHSAEGRDWAGLLGALSGPYPPMTRPCAGLYNGTAMPVKANVCTYRFISQSMAVLDRILGAGHVEYGPELENTRFTTWCKSTGNSRYVLTLAALLGAPQITLSMHDLDGSPIAHEPTVAPLLRETKPRLEALAGLGLAGWRSGGVRFLDDELAARKVQLAAGARMQDLGLVREWEEVLLQCGIPACYAACGQAAAGGGVVALEGYTAWLPSNAELAAILAGAVLLDAEAAWVVQERGFGSSLGVRVGAQADFGCQSEQYREGIICQTEQRIPHRGNRWRQMELAGAELVSELIDARNRRHLGSVVFTNPGGGRIAVINSVGEMKGGFYGYHARLAWLHGLLAWLGRATFPVLPILPHHALCLVREQPGTRLIALANLGTDVIVQPRFRLPATPDPGRITHLDHLGRWLPAEVTLLPAGSSGPCELSVACPLAVFDWLILRLAV